MEQARVIGVESVVEGVKWDFSTEQLKVRQAPCAYNVLEQLHRSEDSASCDTYAPQAHRVDWASLPKQDGSHGSIYSLKLASNVFMQDIHVPPGTLFRWTQLCT